MSKQSKMLKEDILKILAKDVSGGSNTRPAYESAQAPMTFFGGADNQPYYPLAQEPAPGASVMSPIVPGIISGKDASKRPTYQSAKKPLTFFGGGKECKQAKAFSKEVCDEEKAKRKKRAPSEYNKFIKKFFAENKNLGKDRMKKAAEAWKASKSGSAPAKKPEEKKPKIKITTVQPPPPPAGPSPAKKPAITTIGSSPVDFDKQYEDYLKFLEDEKKKDSKKKKGGRKPHPGKPIPKKQLQSYAKKEPSKPKTKRNSAWMAHLAEFRKANPQIKSRDMMKAAKQTYKKDKCGGELVLPSGGAEIKPDIKMTDTHMMPDGTIMPGKTHADSKKVKEIMDEKKAGNAPVAPEKLPEKSDKDQTQIMVDITNSYDNFNKRFEDISNSNASLENKRNQYNSERDKIDKFHAMTMSNYGESLSSENKKIEEETYRYALETYKIGIDSLKAGTPQQRVEFENYDESNTITDIIDEALSFPRGPMDRARSFYSVPIEDQPIQTFNPTVPALGRMASAYPYGYQMNEKAMRQDKIGGKAKSPKQMLAKLTKDMFVRDMSRKYPKVSKEKILDAFKRYKDDINAIMADAILDTMKMRGGTMCGPDEFKSGDRCFKKQARPEKFDRDKFFAEQKRQAEDKERKDDGMVKPNEAPVVKEQMETKRTVDPAMPLPQPKPQNKDEKNFFEKFATAVTPEESGPIFGTDETNLADVRAWVDSAANIFLGTARGIATIFDALGDIF